MIQFLIRIWKRFSAHNMMVASAGVAFYGLLALAPTMIALGSIYGLVTCDTQQIQEQIDNLIPDAPDAAKEQIQALLQDASGATDNGCEAVDASKGLSTNIRRVASFGFSLLLAFWSASGAVQKLMYTITTAYEATESRPGWQVRLMSFLLTVAIIVGVVLLMLGLAVIPAIINELPLSNVGRSVVNIGRYPLLAALYYFGLTVMYRYAPDRRPRTNWFNWGAITGVGIFLLSAVGITIYSRFAGSVPASYGVIGGVAVLMIFLQLMAISALMGAEVDAELAGVTVPQLDEEADTSPTKETSAVGTSGADGSKTSTASAEPVGVGKALAGVAAILLLGGRNE